MSGAPSNPGQNEEQELQQRSSSPRLFQLDALRGIAAVTVVLQHLRNVFDDSQPDWRLAALLSASSSVILFFVLSGYVLSLPYWRDRKPPYSIYLVRRLCRIYLPFAAAAALSVAGAYCFRNNNPTLTDWYAQTWHGPIHAGDVIEQFLMVPMAKFNTAFWSLTFEMQMSIVMPLLCLVMVRAKPVVVTILLAVVTYVRPRDTWTNSSLSLQVLFFFSLGASLAYYDPAIRRLFVRLGKAKWVLLAVSFLLYFNYALLASAGHRRAHSFVASRPWLFMALGASGILVSSLHIVPFARILKHSLPEYLGRISYSLYLMHGVVLFALFDLLWGRIPSPLLVGLVLVTAFLAAHLFCIFIEEPSMRFGKTIAGKMKERL